MDVGGIFSIAIVGAMVAQLSGNFQALVTFLLLQKFLLMVGWGLLFGVLLNYMDALVLIGLKKEA